MKKYILPTLAATLLSAAISAQEPAKTASVEKTIRDLEKAQVAALLRRDIETLDKIFADELYVNSPINKVVRKAQVLQLIRDRRISYSSFKAEIEEIFVVGDSVVVMGHETVNPIDNAPFAGKTVERRYTQVWIKRDGRWQMTARHANIICSN